MNVKRDDAEVVLLASQLGKRSNNRKRLGQIVTCVISLFILCGCSLNQERKVTVSPQQLITESEVLAIADIAITELESLLNFELTHRPAVHFLTPEQLRLHILSRSETVDIERAQTLSHYSQSVVAIYCEYEKDIYVVADNIQLYESPNYSAQQAVYDEMLQILIHELVHAIQDQRGLLNWHSNSTEQYGAFITLVEGHAELQTALVLQRMGVIDDIYGYGLQTLPSSSDDSEFNRYSEALSHRYIVGKRIFNDIHKQYGNDATWLALKAPRQQIQQMLKH